MLSATAAASGGSKPQVLIGSPRAALGEALACALRRRDVPAHASVLEKEALVSAADDLRPAVLLLDGALDPAVASSCATAVRERLPDVRVLLLAGEIDGSTEMEAVEVLSLHIRPGDLVDVVEGRRTTAMVAARRPAGGGGGRPAATTSPIAHLTDREREVLRHLMAGLSSAGIADHLKISSHTVRTHLQNIFAKLGVHTRLEAAAAGLQSGLRPAALPDTGVAAGRRG